MIFEGKSHDVTRQARVFCESPVVILVYDSLYGNEILIKAKMTFKTCPSFSIRP